MLSTRIVQKNARTNNLWGWGRNINFVISRNYNDSDYISSPILTDKPPKFTQVSHGTGFACGIDANNALWCWGRNNDGQLGNNTTTDSSVPIQVSAPVAGYTNKWTSVSCGTGHVLAIIYASGNRYLYSWGINNYGQLGLGDTTNRSFPVKVNSFSWIEISAGAYHSLGIKYDTLSTGYCYGWGRNNYGQLGVGSTTDYSLPTLNANTGRFFHKVAAGWEHSLAIIYNGTDKNCYSWGRNDYGQLGTNNNYYYSSPVQTVGPFKNIEAISAAGKNSGFIYNSSTQSVYTFGHNNYGQLGNNTTNPYSSPIQVVNGNARQVSMISYGSKGGSTFIIKNNNKMYSCGLNNYYQLGDGSNNNRSNFTQIGSTSDWTTLSIGGQSNYKQFMLAIK